MNTRMLLFKLRLCRGISIRGEHRVYQWLLRHPQHLKAVQISVDRLINIAKIYPRFQNKFRQNFNSHELQNMIKINLREKWLSILDTDYPEALKEATLPPNIMFYRGDINLLKGHLLGVVGARKHSQYANNAVNKLLPNLIKHKITIVAGLAEGVDSLGHRCAIANQGHTIGVIGTGLDIYYPKFNYRLQKFMETNQLVITEYPLGMRPRRYHFPERNRIIAGLIQTILIVEAKERSGSLITASLSLKNNRNVTAVPGRIDQPLSKGCNELISSGAKPVIDSNDILEEFAGLS